MPDNSETITIGRDIYLQECASCHGENLAGQANWRQRDGKGYMPAPPHNKNGHTWYHSGNCLLYTSPSPRDSDSSRMPSSA